jgi:hypothetical protein
MTAAVTASGSPRVVECKQGVTTHDALTSSTKAATHKQVHPYLRYGCRLGGYETALPDRLIRHMAHFDFMLFWESQQPSKREWGGARGGTVRGGRGVATPPGTFGRESAPNAGDVSTPAPAASAGMTA